MEPPVAVLRFAAFTATPDGGNPAGLVLDAGGLDEAQMQAIAAEVGYAETAFITQTLVGGDPRGNRVRFFSPIAEVSFCGHATIAAAVVLADRDGVGTFTFHTSVGPIAIETSRDGDTVVASFTSALPSVTGIPGDVLDSLLGELGVSRSDLHPGYPPRLAFAGNWHPILVFADRRVFDSFGFDPDAMRALMDAGNWTTVTTIHATSTTEFEARNLFPVATITEDPATGAAAAAFGAYLRELGLVRPPARIVIHQGRHVGRPGELEVDVPLEGGIVVSGTAVQIDDGRQEGMVAGPNRLP